MYSLLSLKLCSCFGVRKKRKKPGTNMKEVVESGSLAAFKIKKSVRFRQDGDVPKRVNPTPGLRPRAGGGVAQDTLDLGHKPSSTQVESSRVLQGGIKCRSRLKCKDRPVGRTQGAAWLWGSASVWNKQIFHTWLFLVAGMSASVPVRDAFRLFWCHWVKAAARF